MRACPRQARRDCRAPHKFPPGLTFITLSRRVRSCDRHHKRARMHASNAHVCTHEHTRTYERDRSEHTRATKKKQTGNDPPGGGVAVIAISVTYSEKVSYLAHSPFIHRCSRVVSAVSEPACVFCDSSAHQLTPVCARNKTQKKTNRKCKRKTGPSLDPAHVAQRRT